MVVNDPEQFKELTEYAATFCATFFEKILLFESKKKKEFKNKLREIHNQVRDCKEEGAYKFYCEKYHDLNDISNICLLMMNENFKKYKDDLMSISNLSIEIMSFVHKFIYSDEEFIEQVDFREILIDNNENVTKIKNYMNAFYVGKKIKKDNAIYKELSRYIDNLNEIKLRIKSKKEEFESNFKIKGDDYE